MPEPAQTMHRSRRTTPRRSLRLKASLIGAAHRFELTNAASVAHRRQVRVWPYADIAAIRLSFRPVLDAVAPVSRRHQQYQRRPHRDSLDQLADRRADGGAGSRLPRFVTQLMRGWRRPEAGPALAGGLGPRLYAAAVVLLALLAIAMAGLLVARSPSASSRARCS